MTHYKYKIRSAVKKRFSFTKRGKLLRKKANLSHLLEKKSSQRKHSLSKRKQVKTGDYKRVSKILGLKTT